MMINWASALIRPRTWYYAVKYKVYIKIDEYLVCTVVDKKTKTITTKQWYPHMIDDLKTKTDLEVIKNQEVMEILYG